MNNPIRHQRGWFGRTLVAALLALASIVTAPSVAALDNLDEAVDMAGRQRMLSQRIAKYYFQKGIGARTDVAETELTGSMGDFDSALGELKGFAPNGEVLALLNEVDGEWQKLKPLVSAEPDRTSALAVFELSTSVLKRSHKVVVALEELSGKSKSGLINVSGRQRMLSQRLAALYMLRAWNFADESLSEQYATTENEFAAGIETLSSAPQTSAEIKSELRKLERNFKSFRRGADTGGKSVPSVMAHSAEKMLRQSQKIVTMYLALGDKA
ncbi:MAG: type IV pili methyl-accepting chemotaxis transducer N-terminal domain-containing protein [Pseudomonadota bacterium]